MSACFVSGAFGGLVMTTCIGVMARVNHPDRAYGLLSAGAYGFGGLAMLLIPPIVDSFGSKFLFLTLAAVSALAFILVQILPRHEVRAMDERRSQLTRVRKTVGIRHD